MAGAKGGTGRKEDDGPNEGDSGASDRASTHSLRGLTAVTLMQTHHSGRALAVKTLFPIGVGGHTAREPREPSSRFLAENPPGVAVVALCGTRRPGR